MNRERGSGVGTMTAVRSAPSVGGERGMALSRTIGATKSSRASGLRMGEFRPAAPMLTDRKVTGYTHARTTEWKPNVSPPRKEKTISKHQTFTRDALRKPTGEKAGIAPWRTERSSLESKMRLQSQPNILKQIEKADKQGVIFYQRERINKRRSLERRSHRIRKHKRHFRKWETPSVRVSYRGKFLESKAAQSYRQPEPLKGLLIEKYKSLDAAPVRSPREQVLPTLRNEIVVKPSTRDSKATLQRKRQLEAPVQAQKKVEEARITEVVRQIRLLAHASMDTSSPMLSKGNISESVQLQHRVRQKVQQLPLSSMVKKENKQNDTLYYVVDKKAAVTRLNMALLAAARVFARKFYKDAQVKKATGEDIVAHIPTIAPQEGISKLVQVHKSKFDGSYDEWRTRLAAMGEKKNVGEVVQAAKQANHAAPPVEAAREPIAEQVTMKDVLRVLLGAKEEDENR